MDDNILPVRELASPSLPTTIFSHTFNLISAFTYDSTSSYAVQTSPSTMPSPTVPPPLLCEHTPLFLPWFLCPPPPACILFLPHATRTQLGALGRLESARACTTTALVACSHHRGSETCSDMEQTWAQQVIHRQSTRVIGALTEQTVPPNSKSPLVCKLSIWLWFFGFVWF